jgi:hypothetical protein
VLTEALRNLHTARPFQPFVIRRGDGQELPMQHPEMLAYAPKSRTATVYLQDGSFQTIDLLLATGLEVPSRWNGNGRRRRRRRR